MDNLSTSFTQEIKSKLQFLDYVINRVEFKLNPNFTWDDAIDIDFSLNTKMQINHSENSAIVIIDCDIFEDF